MRQECPALAGRPRIIGVTGQIINMDYFGGGGSGAATALEELIARAKVCPTGKENWCEMERIRSELSGYTCAAMDATPPVLNAQTLAVGGTVVGASKNTQEAGLFYKLVSDANTKTVTDFGGIFTTATGDLTGTKNPEYATFTADMAAYTVDFTYEYVVSKSSLGCTLAPRATCPVRRRLPTSQANLDLSYKHYYSACSKFVHAITIFITI